MTHQSPEGLLFVLVGPSGAGKNTLLNAVQQRLPDLAQLPTATTREIRDTEEHGRQHLFVTVDQFNHMRDTDQLLEWQEVHKDIFYGVPRAQVALLERGQDLIADIDMAGAQALRKSYPDNTTIVFIRPPGQSDQEILETLRKRLEERKEKPQEIDKRMKRVAMELEFTAHSDYIIVNEDIDKAADELYQIIVRKREAWKNKRLLPINSDR